MADPSQGFFDKAASQNYDARNRKLAPITECMHFLIQLALMDLQAQSHVLCVGAGTGAEMIALAKAYPDWRFTGVDPSASMLDVCRIRLKEAGILDRCQLIHGYVHDVPAGEAFDAALSVLVAHFVRREDRLDFFRNMTARLKSSGCLVNAEISCDLNSPEFPAMLKDWEKVQSLMGATPESLSGLQQGLRETLSILPPRETEEILRQSGIAAPVRFFQAFMINGWHGKKGL